MTAHAGPIIAERDGMRVVNCHGCGYAHLTELPDQVALDKYYRSEFWATKGAGWLSRYEAEREWVEAKNGDWLSVIEQHTLGRTLLDIGAGYGFFVNQATARGWQALGLEPSAEASEYARTHGANIATETWQEHGPERRYDAMTAFWLLEPLPQPLEFLRWCRRNLYGSGTLTLAVPLEWSTEMMEANPLASVTNWWVHSTHTNYFTAATLSNLLGRAGFRVVDALTTYPMAQWIILGSDYTADAALGDHLHRSVRYIEVQLTRDTRLSLARQRAQQNEGRDLVVVAKVED